MMDEDDLTEDNFNRAMREMSEPRDEAEREAEVRSDRIKTHTLLQPRDCEQTAFHRDGSCPICDGGLGLCQVCGAAEEELAQWTCGEYTELRQNQGQDATKPQKQG